MTLGHKRWPRPVAKKDSRVLLPGKGMDNVDIVCGCVSKRETRRAETSREGRERRERRKKKRQPTTSEIGHDSTGEGEGTNYTK